MTSIIGDDEGILILGEVDGIMLGRCDACNDGDVLGIPVLSTEGNNDGASVGSAAAMGAVVGAFVIYTRISGKLLTVSMNFNCTHI